MYQDVEIIEDDMPVIEISDDDSLQEDDSVSLELVSADVNNTSSSNAEVNCVHLDDETIEPSNSTTASNAAKVDSLELSVTNQNCDIKTGIVSSRLEGNIATTSKCNDDIRKNVLSKRKNRRRRQAIKKIQNKRIVDEQVNKVARKGSIEKKPNSSNSIDRNGNGTPHVADNAPCSSSAITPTCTTNSIDRNENGTPHVADNAPCSSSAITPTCATNDFVTYPDFSKLKWLKPLSCLSTPPHLQIVIIDRSHPFWRIDNDKWLMIEKRLLEALNAEMIQSNDATIGLFEGAKWKRGIKILGCLNENTFSFIRKFVINLDKLWRGAKLDAFPISDINVHEVKAYIPPPTLKTDLVMSLIKLQNPSICTKDWVITRERENTHKGGVDIWIRISDKAFTQLREKNGEIKYGVNRVWFNPTH